MRGQFDTYCNSRVSFVLDDKSHSFIDFSDWLIPVQGHMCAEACSKKKKTSGHQYIGEIVKLKDSQLHQLFGQSLLNSVINTMR